MTLRSKWCVLNVAIRWLILVVCWSVGYLVFHQATQSVPSNIRPAGVTRELLSSEFETARNASSFVSVESKSTVLSIKSEILVSTIKSTSNVSTVSTLKSTTNVSAVSSLKSTSNVSTVSSLKSTTNVSTVSSLTSTSNVSTFSTLKVSEESPDLHLRLAPDIKVSDNELIKTWASKIPSLPLQYQKYAFRYKNSRCASYPRLNDINFNNKIWQEWTSELTGARFYIFGAYWDDRRENNPVVHLLVMVDRVKPPDITCQLWYSKKGAHTPFAVEPTTAPSYSYIWNQKWGTYRNRVLQPYLLTCLLASRKDPPLSVSLVDKPCDNATNNVLVVAGKKRRKESTSNSKLKFAVCVKGLNFYFEDVSVRLIEWLELLRAFGVDKVFVYDLAVHPNVTKVLEYYENQNFVHVSPLTLPGHSLNEKSLMNIYLGHDKIFKRKAEVIPYNDCFYRHRHEYDYISLLDIDEIIVPLQDNTWNDLLQRLTDNGTNPSDSFHASNVYFFDDSLHSHGWDKDIPAYMHMMQHIWRAKNHTKKGTYVKSFYNTQTVLTLHNHLPIRCLDYEDSNGYCKTSSIDVTVAQLQHYRKDCDKSITKLCKTLYHKYLTVDDNLRRYLEPVVSRTNSTLMSLGFMNDVGNVST